MDIHFWRNCFIYFVMSNSNIYLSDIQRFDNHSCLLLWYLQMMEVNEMNSLSLLCVLFAHMMEDLWPLTSGHTNETDISSAAEQKQDRQASVVWNSCVTQNIYSTFLITRVTHTLIHRHTHSLIHNNSQICVESAGNLIIYP